MMSTGLPRDQLAGSTLSRSRMRPSPSSASGTLCAAAASAAITPTPPPLVRMVILSPMGDLKRVRISAARNSSSRLSTRSMPARAMAASTTLSAPASAPVCEAAAFWPCSLRPALTTITGLLRAAERAADMNLRAWSTDSMYSRMARVWGSLAR